MLARLLTAQRLRKIAHMRWDDISPEGVWTVRSAEREKGNVGKVQLPELARSLLATLPRVSGNPYVFPAAHGLTN